MIRYLFICAGCFTFLWGCKKEEPPFSTTPEISFKTVTPSVAVAFKDSLTFEIMYKDGDGDLGENNANVENLFLTDNRINLTYKYRIKQLAPDGDPIPIQGSLSIILKNTALTDTNATQTTTFSIYVLDRAGNKSNVIESKLVTVIKE